MHKCSLAWGDYDNDGDLDLALAGRDTVGPLSKIYRNDGGTLVNDGNDGGNTFTDIGAGLTGVYACSLAWGDYDNDGDLDLALAGSNVTKVYRLDGGSPNSQPWSPGNLEAGNFVLATLSGEIELTQGSDVVTGYDTAFLSEVSPGDLIGYEWGNLWVEVASVTDNRNLRLASPYPGYSNWGPALVRKAAGTGTVTFSWQGGGDDQTDWSALTRNLRVGTTPGSDDVFSGMADPLSGRRRIPAMGNAQHRNSWTLTGLPDGTYYWSVQLIDPGFLASEWSNERPIAVGSAPDLVATVVPSNADPNVGDVISVDVLVENVGTADAGPCQMSLFYSRWDRPYVDDGADDMRAVPALPVGAGPVTLTFSNISQETASGGQQWRIYAAVDTARIVVESDETNNVSLPATVTWHGPDIVIDNMDVSDPNPFAGDYVSVTITIRNQGDVPTGQFEVGLFYDSMWPPMAGDPADSSQTVFGLAADETTTVKFTGITSATEGGREVYAIVDNAPPPGGVLEADEYNNSSQIWIEWRKPFLFSISSTSASFQAVAGTVGVLTKTITVSHTRSVGDPVQISIITDPPEGLEYVTVTPTSFSLPPGGSRTVYVQLDPSDIDPTRSMSLQSVGLVRVSDANGTDELTFDVRVGIEPGVAGFDFAFDLGLGCTPVNRSGAAAAIALCVIALRALLRRRRAASETRRVG
jgi:hypothetical protein